MRRQASLAHNRGSMGHIFYCFVLLSSLIATLCAADSKTFVKLEDLPEPKPPAGTEKIWSAMQTDLVDHVYSTNKSEVQHLIDFYGFFVEGKQGTTTGFVYSKPHPDTVPLYRLYAIGLTDHLLTTSKDERNHAMKRLGYHLQGIIGYVYPSAGTGRVPFYRLHNEPAHDHYYTSSEQEREDASRNGWKEEGILAYLLPESS